MEQTSSAGSSFPNPLFPFCLSSKPCFLSGYFIPLILELSVWLEKTVHLDRFTEKSNMSYPASWGPSVACHPVLWEFYHLPYWAFSRLFTPFKPHSNSGTLTLSTLRLQYALNPHHSTSVFLIFTLSCCVAPIAHSEVSQPFLQHPNINLKSIIRVEWW